MTYQKTIEALEGLDRLNALSQYGKEELLRIKKQERLERGDDE